MNMLRKKIHDTRVLNLIKRYLKTGKGRAGIRIHEKSIDRFKNRIRELTRRNQGCSLEQMLQKLRQYTTGWLNYYAVADMKEFMQQSNGWIKRKIRCYIWKQWKRIKARFENL